MNKTFSALLLDLHRNFTSFVESFDGEDKVGLEFVAVYAVRSRLLEDASMGRSGSFMYFGTKTLDPDEQRILALCDGDTDRACQAVVKAAEALGVYAVSDGEGRAVARIGIPEIEERMGYYDGARGVSP